MTICFSESATVFFVISLSICYWLLKCRVLCVVFVCVCMRESETRSHNRGLCANTYELHQCVCHATLFPSRLELMVKLRTLLTFNLKAKACNYGKGRYISDSCLWCTQHRQRLVLWNKAKPMLLIYRVVMGLGSSALLRDLALLAWLP